MNYHMNLVSRWTHDPNYCANLESKNFERKNVEIQSLEKVEFRNRITSKKVNIELKKLEK